MCGGETRLVNRVMPIFDALRPEGPRDEGFVHAGDVGAGHYTKMVHNGIEYGLMAAYAEGYELLEKKDIVKDVPGAFKAWSRGTVVRSWLLDLAVAALEANPTLDGVSDYTVDSGEGKWTVEEADRPRRADAGDLGVAVRPVRVAAGGLADDADGRRVARPVRRAPGHDDQEGEDLRRKGIAGTGTSPPPRRRRPCASRSPRRATAKKASTKKVAAKKTAKKTAVKS
jgi:6-phosphogluconate dehydrogenase